MNDAEFRVRSISASLTVFYDNPHSESEAAHVIKILLPSTGKLRDSSQSLQIAESLFRTKKLMPPKNVSTARQLQLTVPDKLAGVSRANDIPGVHHAAQACD